MDQLKDLYTKLIKDGEKYKICNAGMHAMDILRMEKGYLHWGHDISPEENQYEAGLNFAISYKKEVDFIGKKALLKIKELKPKKKLVILSLLESLPGKPLLLHDEPIYCNGDIVGRTTSGNYSFNFKKSFCFGYIDHNIIISANKELQVEVEKVKYKAKLHSLPFQDPNNKYIKS